MIVCLELCFRRSSHFIAKQIVNIVKKEIFAIRFGEKEKFFWLRLWAEVWEKNQIGKEVI